MEAPDVRSFFRPCARLQGADANGVEEFELTVPLEEFANSSVSRWDEFRAFLGDVDDTGAKVAWVGDDAFISNYDLVDVIGFMEDWEFGSGSDGDFETVQVYSREGIEAPPTALRNFLWHLLAESEYPQMYIQSPTSHDVLSIPAAVIADFLSRSRKLGRLTFSNFVLDEDHCRSLASVDKPDIRLCLWDCTVSNPVVLCESRMLISLGVDVAYLRGLASSNNLELLREKKSPVRKYWVDDSKHGQEEGRGERMRQGSEVLRALAQALVENEGIEILKLHHVVISNDIWELLFRSMHKHPNLRRLHFQGTWPEDLSSEDIQARVQALRKMLRANPNIHTIDILVEEGGEIDQRLVQEPLYQESILPLLEANLYRPRIAAMLKAPPALRPALLARALWAVRDNPRLLWQLLSANVDIFAPKDGGASGVSNVRARARPQPSNNSSETSQDPGINVEPLMVDTSDAANDETIEVVSNNLGRDEQVEIEEHPE